jgi:hypothetical protein
MAIPTTLSHHAENVGASDGQVVLSSANSLSTSDRSLVRRVAKDALLRDLMTLIVTPYRSQVRSIDHAGRRL